MAYTKLSFIFLHFIFLLFILSHGTLGSDESTSRGGSRGQSEHRFEQIRAVEPSRSVESEAGVTEYWDESEQQFRSAGVAATRHTIQPKGLLLPSFSNAPRLIYVIQGRGISGFVLPGCPESFQSLEQSQRSQEREHERRERRSSGDQHQKIRRIRKGDVVALPAGVAHWFYNDGETPVIAVTVLDTGNSANQLDQNPRKFFLAGSQPREGWHHDRHGEGRSGSNNILSGFDAELLAEAAGTSREIAEKLRGRDDHRGSIVRVENGLQLVRPQRRGEEEEEREERGEEERERRERGERGPEEERERREGGDHDKGVDRNGLEEALCNLRLKENIDDPSRADVYNPHAGRITTVNSQKLPVLRYLRLSAERGSLNKNAVLAPHWNNAHSIVYVINGRARVQIVNDNGNSVFNGELRQGQLIIVPQDFAVVKKARDNEEFEWISFKTDANPIVSPIFGRSSVLQGLPENVIASSFRIRREEARRVKDNRGEELRVLAPRSQERASS